jgi:Lon protease-like protein
MAESQNIIPLFPLPLAVFPTESAPLHIFEPRYRKLVRDAMDSEKRKEPFLFGIVLGSPEKMNSVGCAVRIQEILREYDDGRIDLLVLGKKRFTLNEALPADNDEDYDRGAVEWLTDPSSDWSEQLANHAYMIHREMIKSILGSHPDTYFYQSRSILSYFIGQSIGLDPQGKQRMLECLSENERLEFMIEYMTQYLQDLKRVGKIQHNIQNSWSYLILSNNGDKE